MACALGDTPSKAAAARTWTAEPAAPRTRTAEAAAATGSRTAKAATASARTRAVPLTGRTRRSIFTRARFAHRQVAPLEGLRVDPLDDFLGLTAIGKLHERKPTRTSGFTVDRHDYVGGFGDSREVGAKVGFAGPVGKVPDEQTDSQGFPRKRLRFYPRTPKPRR